MNASPKAPTVQCCPPAPGSRVRTLLARVCAAPLPAAPLPLRPGALLSITGATLALLMAMAASPALAAAGDRPRPQDYPDYSRYIQALVDYQRAQEARPAEAPTRSKTDPNKLCRDEKGGTEDEKRKNTCEGKYLLTEDLLPDGAEHGRPSDATAPHSGGEDGSGWGLNRDDGFGGSGDGSGKPGESLEDTIARKNPFYGPEMLPDGSTLGGPRDLSSMQELAAADLSESGVSGLLGLFNNVRIQSLGSAAAPSGVYGSHSSSNGGGTLASDGTMRFAMDDILLNLSTLNLEPLGLTLSFDNGYSVVDASVRTTGDGLTVGLSAQTYLTSVNIVDSDGLPGTHWAGAGALTVEQLGIVVPYAEANLRSVNVSSSDSSVLQADIYSPSPIYVNLANNHIGVAPATRDGSWIGTPTNFVSFGPDSVMTIAAGTRISAVLSPPNGLKTPFLTLNGHIGDISLRDVGVEDAVSGGSFGFGNLALYGLDLDDAKIYMSNNSLKLDTGRSFSDVSIDLERFYLGDEGSNIVGDFYARQATLNNLRMTVSPH